MNEERLEDKARDVVTNLAAYLREQLTTIKDQNKVINALLEELEQYDEENTDDPGSPQ